MTENDSTKKVSGNDAGDEPTKQQLRTKAFRVALEMVAVFGVPAATALLAGRWLHNQGGQPEWVTYGLLGAAFIISWVIVFYRVRSIAREFKNSQQKQEATDDGSRDDAATEEVSKNDSS